MVNKKIETIEGIGPTYGAKLREAGITDTDGLLASGRTSAGRKELAALTGLQERQLLTWVNMADLFRIKGVGAEFAELLEAAGVDTVKELRTRNAENLVTRMAEINAERKLTRQVPPAKSVQGWVAEAGELPPMVEY